MWRGKGPRRGKSRRAGERARHRTSVSSCLEREFATRVGAGLALPPFHTIEELRGQGKPSPYAANWLRLRRAT